MCTIRGHVASRLQTIELSSTLTLALQTSRNFPSPRWRRELMKLRLIQEFNLDVGLPKKAETNISVPFNLNTSVHELLTTTKNRVLPQLTTNTVASR